MHTLRIFFFMLLPVLVAGRAFAVVNFQTLIRDVEVQQPNQRTGDIRFVVQGDDFPDASPSQPVYIRLRLDHGAVLQETLVDPSVPGLVSRPIYLAIRAQTGDPDVQVVANRDSVAIVRWRAGEQTFWVRINRSTDSWLEIAGDPMPPSFLVHVTFTIGETMMTSFQNNHSAYLAGHANLMSNKRCMGPPTGTELMVDLTNSNLQPLPAPSFLSLLRFDPVAFDSTTQFVATAADEDDIVLGNLLPVPFSGDRSIARGKLTPSSKRRPVSFNGGDEGMSDTLLAPGRATVYPKLRGEEASLLFIHNPGEDQVALQVRSLVGPHGQETETVTVSLEPGEIGTIAIERRALGLSLLADGPLVILSDRSPAR